MYFGILILALKLKNKLIKNGGNLTMKATKKKFFKKATFLFLACMLMLVPFTFGVAALNNEILPVIVEEDPIIVTMSSGGCVGGNHTSGNSQEQKMKCQGCGTDWIITITYCSRCGMEIARWGSHVC